MHYPYKIIIYSREFRGPDLAFLIGCLKGFRNEGIAPVTLNSPSLACGRNEKLTCVITSMVTELLVEEFCLD